MTVADLMLGDRPARVRCELPRLSRRGSALLALIAALSALGAVLGAPPLVVLLAALLAGQAAWRASWAVSERGAVWLEGGGRRALSSQELVGWLSHWSLMADEREAAQQAAEAKKKVAR